MNEVFILLIKSYRALILPLIPPDTCRFYPSCSAYALEVLEHHGTLGSLILISKRILRCHRWNPGGYDPVPRDPI